jgi:transcriptional regulator with XRE-family HTH domain
MSVTRSSEYLQFLKELYKARVKSGLTQSEVATYFGKHQSFVSKSEQGDRVVSVIDAYNFAKLYNVSLDSFFKSDNDE